MLWREECSATLPHIGYVVLWAWVFYWTETWHFLFWCMRWCVIYFIWCDVLSDDCYDEWEGMIAINGISMSLKYRFQYFLWSILRRWSEVLAEQAMMMVREQAILTADNAKQTAKRLLAYQDSLQLEQFLWIMCLGLISWPVYPPTILIDGIMSWTREDKVVSVGWCWCQEVKTWSWW